MTPEWLPLQLNLVGSSIEDDYRKLHEVYERDFILSSMPTVDGSKVVVNNRPDLSIMGGVYTYGFTHLITCGETDRFIDYDRAKKLPWVRSILDNYMKPEVSAFYVEHAKGETLYLWLADSDFVVILRPLKSKRERAKNPRKIIVTSYHIHSGGRYKLQRLYGRSIRQL